MQVAIVRTGVANTASVVACLSRLGASCTITEDPREIDLAQAAVLPGVGSFAAACERLDELGMREVLRERISSGRSTLCVCLGMQLLADASEEAPGAPGLGVLSVTVRRFPTSVKRTQLGWNLVRPAIPVRPTTPAWPEPGYAYFANSYRVSDVQALQDAGWQVAIAEHGGPFVAAARKGRVLACQFHPELSGAWGESLIGDWLRSAANEPSPTESRKEAPC